MKRILIMLVGVCCMFSPAFSEVDNGKKGVFFCTVDTDSELGSIVFNSKIQCSDNTLSAYYYKEIVVKQKDSLAHSHIRHCFNMLGTSHNRTNVSIDEQLLILNVHETLGYYPTDMTITINGTTGYKGHIQNEGFWLFNPTIRDNFTVSCTSVLEEGMSGFRKNTPSADDVDDFWNELSSKMHEDVKLHPIHDMLKHSCCSVAFGSLRAVRDDAVLDFNPNLADIKKRRFNICGKGIPFDAQDDTTWESSKGVSRALLDAFLILPKAAWNKMKSFMPTSAPRVEQDDNI
jgi:hypothetical protein